MTTPAHLSEAQVEQAARQRARYEIEAIAYELKRPVGEVAELYTLIYSELRPRALVVDFLPLLVARKVRLHYRRRLDAVVLGAPGQH